MPPKGILTRANLYKRLALLVITGIGVSMTPGCDSPASVSGANPSSTNGVGQIRVVNLSSKPIHARIPTKLNDTKIEPYMGTELTKVRSGEKSVGFGYSSSKDQTVTAAVEGSKATTLLVTVEGTSLKTYSVVEPEHSKPSKSTLVVRIAGEDLPSALELKQGSKVSTIRPDETVDLEHGEHSLVATFPNGKKIRLIVPAKGGGSFTALFVASKGNAIGTCVRNDVILTAVGESGASK